MSATTLEPPDVAKKKTGTGKTKQINVRVPVDIADRLEQAAVMLATDASHLLRLLLVEKLPEYEERGRRARGIPSPAEE